MPDRRSRAASSSEGGGDERARKARRTARRRKKAKQWTYYIETLKSTVDCLYEMCRAEHSVVGCEEAIMYLRSSTTDFEKLIDSINVELNWNDDDKHQAVAWEIRKTMRSPTHALKELGAGSGTPAHPLMHMLPISPIVLAEAVRNCEHAKQEQNVWEKRAREAASQFPPCADDAHQQEDEGAGWETVVRRKRRGSTSTTTSLSDRERIGFTPERVVAEEREPSVYERLSSTSGYRRPSSAMSKGDKKTLPPTGRLMCPKSAMDLPQTKASMAKMAYSRQLLWQRTQVSLAEKLKARQRRERPAPSSPSSTRRAQSACGLNFADAAAVQKSARAFNEQRSTQRQRRQNSAPLSESGGAARSLGSIREAARETEDSTEAVPCDPAPRDPAPPRDGGSVPSVTRSEPVAGWLGGAGLDLESDAQWREMTEEEESLALEESSLHEQIQKEERMSIDAELERQVEAEAAALEQREQEDERRRAAAAAAPQQPMTWQEIVKKWEVEVQEMASVSWSELVEKEFAGNYRLPGDAVHKQQRLNSPSRRRCEKSDVDLQHRHTEKLRRAAELRAQLSERKQNRLKELSNRVAEVRLARVAVTERKRAHLEEKMRRAVEKRDEHIEARVSKARDDEQKVLEANFINNLEAGNLRYDIDRREEEFEERRQSLAVERARKVEEKAAKEHAAEERRRVLEQERVNRIQEMNERKEVRYAQINAQRLEKERERKEKRRQKQERVEARQAEYKSDMSRSLEEGECRSALMTPDPKEAVLVEEEPAVVPSWSKWMEDGQRDEAKTWRCARCDVLLVGESAVVVHVLGEEHGERWSGSDDLSPAAIDGEMREAIEATLPLDNHTTPVDAKKRRDMFEQSMTFIGAEMTLCPLEQIEGAGGKARSVQDLVTAFGKKTGSEAGRRQLKRAAAAVEAHLKTANKEERDSVVLQMCRSGVVPNVVDWALKGEGVATETMRALLRRVVEVPVGGMCVLTVRGASLCEWLAEEWKGGGGGPASALCDTMLRALTLIFEYNVVRKAVAETAAYLCWLGVDGGCVAAYKDLDALRMLLSAFLAFKKDKCVSLVSPVLSSLLDGVRGEEGVAVGVHLVYSLSTFHDGNLFTVLSDAATLRFALIARQIIDREAQQMNVELQAVVSHVMQACLALSSSTSHRRILVAAGVVSSLACLPACWFVGSRRAMLLPLLVSLKQEGKGSATEAAIAHTHFVKWSEEQTQKSAPVAAK